MAGIRDLIKKVDMSLMLEKMGKEYVEWLKELLQIADKIASGRLLKSIDYKILKQTEKYLLAITAEDYLKYVDTGRKAGKKMPPKGVIAKWAKTRNLSLKKGQTYDQVEFLIRRKIKRDGIEPTNVLFQTRQGVLRKAKDLKIPEETKQRILNEVTNALISESGGAKVTIKRK